MIAVFDILALVCAVALLFLLPILLIFVEIVSDQDSRLESEVEARHAQLHAVAQLAVAQLRADRRSQRVGHNHE